MEYTTNVNNETGNGYVSVPQSAIQSGENSYTITGTDPAGNIVVANGTFTDTPPMESSVNSLQAQRK